MGVSIEDGIRSVTCDNKECEREIREVAVNKFPYVFHPECVPA